MGIFSDDFMRMAKKIARPADQYFFEFTGYSGRIYVDNFYFGVGFALTNVASTGLRVIPPVKMYPALRSFQITPLYLSLQDLQTKGVMVKPLMHECLIKVEKTKGGNTEIETLYKLSQVEIIRANISHKEGAIGYEFKFRLGEVVSGYADTVEFGI